MKQTGFFLSNAGLDFQDKLINAFSSNGYKVKSFLLDNWCLMTYNYIQNSFDLMLF